MSKGLRLQSLPVDVLSVILALVVRLPPLPPLYEEDYTPSFAERQAAFFAALHKQGKWDMSSVMRRGEDVFLSRPRFTLTVDTELAMSLALMCKSFFEALRRLPDVKKQVTRLDCIIGLMGTSYDGDLFPYFPARFCSEDHQYQKEVVDTMGHHLPCERSFELDGKFVTVTFAPQDELAMPHMDGFILFYDHTKAGSIDDLNKTVATIMREKKWKHMRNTVLVSSFGAQRAEPMANAIAFAESLDIPHLEIHVAQRITSQLTERQQNVKEAVYSVARMIGQKEMVMSLPPGHRKQAQCAVM